MSDLEKGQVIADRDQERLGGSNARPRSESDYILSRWGRRLFFYVGILVAYSQFVSIALLAFYRYHDAWEFGRYYKEDEYLGGSFLVLWLFSPSGEIGTNEEYPIWFTIPVALVIALLGSAGLFVLAYAKRHWRLVKSLLFVSFTIGFAATVLVTGTHIFDGASRLSWLNFMYLDSPYEFFPMHGVLEYVGAIVIPALLYPALVLWLFVRAIRMWVKASK